MTYPRAITEALEYDSAIEFVLVVTIGQRRAVVAKSKGAGIDLASYSQSNFRRVEYRPSILMKLFSNPTKSLTPLVAESHPVESDFNREYDARGSEITLIWRGLDRPGLGGELQSKLTDIGPVLYSALHRKSSIEVEWLLSPLLAICSEALIAEQYKRAGDSVKYRAGVFFTLLYTLFGLAYSAYALFK